MLGHRQPLSGRWSPCLPASDLTFGLNPVWVSASAKRLFQTAMQPEPLSQHDAWRCKQTDFQQCRVASETRASALSSVPSPGAGFRFYLVEIFSGRSRWIRSAIANRPERLGAVWEPNEIDLRGIPGWKYL